MCFGEKGSATLQYFKVVNVQNIKPKMIFCNQFISFEKGGLGGYGGI